MEAKIAKYQSIKSQSIKSQSIKSQNGSTKIRKKSVGTTELHKSTKKRELDGRAFSGYSEDLPEYISSCGLNCENKKRRTRVCIVFE